MEEALKSIADGFRYRLKNPYSFSLIISILVINWKVFAYAIWSHEPISLKIENVSESLTICSVLLVPICTAFLYLVGLEIILWALDLVRNEIKRRRMILRFNLLFEEQKKNRELIVKRSEMSSLEELQAHWEEWGRTRGELESQSYKQRVEIDELKLQNRSLVTIQDLLKVTQDGKVVEEVENLKNKNEFFIGLLYGEKFVDFLKDISETGYNPEVINASQDKEDLHLFESGLLRLNSESRAELTPKGELFLALYKMFRHSLKQ